MTPSALGPAGVAQRMDEIRAKMQTVFGTPDDYSGFQQALSSAGTPMPGQLSGGIGGNVPAGMEGFSLTPDGNGQIQQLAVQAAQKYKIDPNVFVALINQESGFNPLSTNPQSGAAGLSQLMPGTAAGLGVKNRLDPVQSLDGGAKYFSQMLDRFGSTELALAAYNAGPGKVDEARGIPDIPETQNYVRSIMNAVSKRSKP